MKIIGLTGPSGAGKGLACDIFARYGIPSVNTDAVYHTLLESHTPLRDELTEAFGQDILESGRVDRKKLAQSVFGHTDTAQRVHTLNAITHKYIMAQTWKEIKAFGERGARAAIIDAPQLFEAEIQNDCDFVVGVLAPVEQRLARVIARDGITAETAENRFSAQKDEGFYRTHCQYILESNTDTATLEQQIRHFLVTSGLGLDGEKK